MKLSERSICSTSDPVGASNPSSEMTALAKWAAEELGDLSKLAIAEQLVQGEIHDNDEQQSLHEAGAAALNQTSTFNSGATLSFPQANQHKATQATTQVCPLGLAAEQQLG